MEVQKQKPVSEKKLARRAIYEKLALALQEYKVNFKEEKFDTNLKKASRLFAADLARAMKTKKLKAKKDKPKKAKSKKDKSKKNSPKINKEVLTATNGVV